MARKFVPPAGDGGQPVEPPGGTICEGSLDRVRGHFVETIQAARGCFDESG